MVHLAGGNLVAAIASLLTFLAFVIIAGQLALSLIEMYIVIGGGVLLLGFAGSRWTMPFAERYLSYAVAIGIKLFVLYLIIGVGTALAASWAPTLANAGTSPSDLFAILGASLVYMIVAWQIPSFASSLIAGSVNLTLGSALYTGGSMAAMALGVKGIAARAAAAGVRGSTAVVEAGRYARDARAAGSAGMIGSVTGGFTALATEAVAARARRVAGIPAARTTESLRERRIARFGDPRRQLGAGRAADGGAVSRPAARPRVSSHGGGARETLSSTTTTPQPTPRDDDRDPR
ncbi:MAG: type IV secretion system protein [Myxococcota bacterium]|nr:type IV secretion system protein [Myxococcota bacterium]